MLWVLLLQGRTAVLSIPIEFLVQLPAVLRLQQLPLAVPLAVPLPHLLAGITPGSEPKL